MKLKITPSQSRRVNALVRILRDTRAVFNDSISGNLMPEGNGEYAFARVLIPTEILQFAV